MLLCYMLPCRDHFMLLDSGFNINTVREAVGHCDERTTLNNYCFDTRTEDEIIALYESALG